MAEQIQIADLMARSGVGFGTSGARGRVADMSAPVCYAYTLGFLQHLAERHGLPPGSTVALAGDLRPSTPAILAACAAAVVDAGHRPLNGGFIPSPAIALYGLERGIPSLMVTGSHIPDDRNGIKFNTAAGEILKADEEGIRAQLVRVPERIVGNALPPLDPEPRAHYLRRYLDFFDPTALADLRVAVYEHSGVARDLLGEVLAGLGAEVIPLGRSVTFIPVDTEAIRSEDIELARAWARDPGFDAIVSTDGDADRPLIGTERGEWLRGDVAGVLCARALGIQALATPVSSNTVVEACGAFRAVRRTRIGSPYVIAGMQALRAEGHGSVAGYEANGGFLLETPVEREGRILTPLPTRDALLPILVLLAQARAEDVPLGALPARLPPRYTASDRLKDFPTESSRTLIADLQAGGAGAMERLFGDLCGQIASIDTTDGLRMGFANGEIIHLRPSGNAPEFRCYNEAASEARAQELNRACLSRIREVGLPVGG